MAKYDPSEYRNQVKPYHTPASDKQWCIFDAVIQALEKKRMKQQREQSRDWTQKINFALKLLLAGEISYFLALVALMFL